MDMVRTRHKINPHTGNVTLLRMGDSGKAGWEDDKALRRVVTAIWLLQGYPDAVNKPPVLIQGSTQQVDQAQLQQQAIDAHYQEGSLPLIKRQGS